MKRQVAVVARARDERGRGLVDPDVGHAGAPADRAGIDIGRCAVEQHARPSLRVVAGHDAPDRLHLVRHRFPRVQALREARSARTTLSSHPIIYHDGADTKGHRDPGRREESRCDARGLVALVVALAAGLAPAGRIAAQAQSFPNHPIKIIIGPSPDIFSRIIARTPATGMGPAGRGRAAAGRRRQACRDSGFDRGAGRPHAAVCHADLHAQHRDEGRLLRPAEGIRAGLRSSG